MQHKKSCDPLPLGNSEFNIHKYMYFYMYLYMYYIYQFKVMFNKMMDSGFKYSVYTCTCNYKHFLKGLELVVL